MILVELCAGSAAVSMRWLSASQRLPFGYAGGKRGYADQILSAMGLSPGGVTAADSVVLVEPGMWGEAWRVWCNFSQRREVVERILFWSSADPRELWTRISRAEVPTDPAERVAAWCVLMFWGYARKPVFPVGRTWKHHGFESIAPYRKDIAAAKRAAGIKYETAPNLRLPELSARIERLETRAVRAVYRSVDEFFASSPEGALIYIDPPYHGTTCAYGHDFPRGAVLRVAEQLAHQPVLVSEAEPLPLASWHHIELRAARGRGRNNFSRQQREFLTLSPAATRHCPDHLLYPGVL